MQAALRQDTAPDKNTPAGMERLFREHHRRVYLAAYRITGNAMDAEDVLQTVFLRLLRREQSERSEQSRPGALSGSSAAGAGEGVGAVGGHPSGHLPVQTGPVDRSRARSAVPSGRVAASEGSAVGTGDAATHRSEVSAEAPASVSANVPASYLHLAAINGALDIVRARAAARAKPLEDAESELMDAPSARPDGRQRDKEIRECVRVALGRMNPRTAEIFALRYLEGYSNLEIARMLHKPQALIAVTLHRARRRLREEIRPLVGGRS